jgi:sulfatase modifying factor 1
MNQTGGIKSGFLNGLLAILFFATCVHAVTIATVPVGDVGNPNDPSDGDSLTAGVQNFGAVGYAYRIGKYEVTVGQYTAFLNAVAATDTFGLYNPNMATRLAIAGIAQSGSSGSFTYSVIGSPNHPVTYVSWGDAARFANWIQNGQPTGTQNNLTTEDGAYSLNGATTHETLYTVTRHANAAWFVPSENEWYKAAYYQPAAQGGDSDSYWLYPMKTNSFPYSAPPPGAAAPDNTRAGNFYFNDKLANGYNDGYAVTGLSTGCLNSDGNNCVTDVGAYSSSPSFYGTFDQGGNVYEWTEGLGSGFGRYERGGSWAEGKPQSSWHDNLGGAVEHADIGFRLASISIPGDFNGDLIVDSADYLSWRKSGGSASDYDLWRAHFGESIGGASLGVTISEPSTILLSMVLLIGVSAPRNYR